MIHHDVLGFWNCTNNGGDGPPNHRWSQWDVPHERLGCARVVPLLGDSRHQNLRPRGPPTHLCHCTICKPSRAPRGAQDRTSQSLTRGTDCSQLLRHQMLCVFNATLGFFPSHISLVAMMIILSIRRLVVRNFLRTVDHDEKYGCLQQSQSVFEGVASASELCDECAIHFCQTSISWRLQCAHECSEVLWNRSGRALRATNWCYMLCCVWDGQSREVYTTLTGSCFF